VVSSGLEKDRRLFKGFSSSARRGMGGPNFDAVTVHNALLMKAMTAAGSTRSRSWPAAALRNRARRRHPPPSERNAAGASGAQASYFVSLLPLRPQWRVDGVAP